MKSSPSPKIVNVGLIGCGARLRTVLKAITSEDPENRIRVVSAYDPNPASVEAAREQFGMDCKVSSSEEELVSDPEIDWVFIGSWNCHHARQAVLALSAGKNVFCEKPLATNLADCLEIREAARKSGKVFAFGLVLRYSPHYQRIMEVVSSGAIGRIISFEFNETLGFNHGGYIFGNWRRERKNAGTHLLEKCCHDIDLANWIIGSLPVRAASFGGRDFFTPDNAGHVERIGPDEQGVTAYSSWPDPQPVRPSPFDGNADIFDNQVAILEYANGARGTFHTNCNTGTPERRFYLCGTEGTLRADVVARTIEVQRIGWNSKIEKVQSHEGDGHGGGDEAMGKAMVETLLRGVPPLASCEDGIKSSIVAFGLDQAADEGRVVNLTPMWDEAGLTHVAEAIKNPAPNSVQPNISSIQPIQPTTTMNTPVKRLAEMIACMAILFLSIAFAPTAHSAPGVWLNTGAANANWTTASNWSGGTVPGATAAITGSNANTDTATFSTAVGTYGTIGTPIVIDSASENFKNITFQTGAGSFTIGTTSGNPIYLTKAGLITIMNTLTTTNAVETINAPLVIESGSGWYTVSNDSANGTGAGVGTLNFGGGITGGAAGSSTLILQGSNTNANTISGVIGNGLATTLVVTKSGNGTWVLSGANTYTGATSVNAGIVNYQNGTAFGTNSAITVASGATAQVQGTITGGSQLLKLAGTGAAGATGALENVSGTNGYAGLLQLTAASTISSDAGKLNLTHTGTITGATFGLTLTGAGDGSIASVIGTTSGGLTKSGTGTWTLSGVNTYTGATLVSSGTLVLSGSGSINGSALTVNGGTLRNNSSTNYTGALTFTSGAVGGTNLNGSLGGLTIGTNQTLSPGNSPGTASTTSQAWAGGGTYVWEINNATGTAGVDPGWDLLSGTGALTISATSGSKFNIAITSLDPTTNAAGSATNFNGLTMNYQWKIADFASAITLDATAFNLNTSAFSNTVAAGSTWAIVLGNAPGITGGDNTQLWITYSIPEPSTWALLAFSLTTVMILRRRRSD